MEDKEKLWTKDFVLVIIINFLVFLNHLMILSTFPFFIERLGYSDTVSGACATAFSLVAVLARPFVGWLLDTGRRREVGQVFAIGIPASITNIAQSFCVLITNRFLVPYGTDKVAAMGIALKVSMIAVLVLIGFAFGVQPLVGYNYGAQNYRRLRQVLRFSYQFTIGLGLVLTVIVFAAAPLLIRLFMQDGSVYDLGVAMLRRLLLGTAFYAFTLVTTCVFQATGKAVGAFVLSISGQGVIYGLVIWALSSIWGYDGVIVTQPVADVLTCLLAVVLYFTSLHRVIRKGVAEQKES